ncbi:MAG: metallophosphoesterase [Mycoplasmatales bacterium]
MKKIWIIIIVGIGWLQGERLVVTKYQLDFDEITKPMKIMQLSDLHSLARPGKQQQIIETLKSEKPDILLLTGDILTGFEDKMTIDFIGKLFLQPTFYVSGNHEFDYGVENYQANIGELKKLGVIVLDDERAEVDQINLIGIADDGITYLMQEPETVTAERERNLKEFITKNKQKEKLNIVLNHRPQYLKTYVDTNADLVFSGHAHGGQWRLPIGNVSIIAPDQGLFPKYTYGLYQEQDTSLIISSGIEYINVIPRFYNPREIVICEVM